MLRGMESSRIFAAQTEPLNVAILIGSGVLQLWYNVGVASSDFYWSDTYQIQVIGANVLLPLSV